MTERVQPAASGAVLTEIRAGALVITINRPAVRNAINAEVAAGLAKALDRLDADPELSVGVITGAGGFFCAGMDLGAFVDGQLPFVEGRGFGGITERAADKPLIAAVEGFAVAGGFEVALCCDLIVAARGARFGVPEVKRSLVALGGALLRLPVRMPYHAAMELVLTGELTSAERLFEFGVINRLTEPGDAVRVALEMAAAIGLNGPLAVRATKRIVEQQSSWSAGEKWSRQAAIGEPVIKSEDAAEGALAFKEKRDPVWRGR